VGDFWRRCGLIVIRSGRTSRVGGQEASAAVSPDGSTRATHPAHLRRPEQLAALAAVRERARARDATTRATLGERCESADGVVGSAFTRIPAVDIALKHAALFGCKAAEAARGPPCGLGRARAIGAARARAAAGDGAAGGQPAEGAAACVAELIGDAAQTADALVDLAILSCARALASVGTQLSTFSDAGRWDGRGARARDGVFDAARRGRAPELAARLEGAERLCERGGARALSSFGHEQLRALPCAAERGCARALLAVGGDGNARTGADGLALAFAGSAGGDELLAHALATAAADGGRGDAAGADADADAAAADADADSDTIAARTAADRREVASVRRRIGAHEVRVRGRRAQPAAKLCAPALPARLLLGRSYAFG
jgi:hypothetical protein